MFPLDRIELDFFGGLGISSQAIEWFSAGKFSHVATKWDQERLLDSRSDVVGGVSVGVRIRAIADEAALARLQVRFSLAATPVQIRVFRDFLAQQIGKLYDKPGIVGFAFGRNWREDDSWFCSELCAAALEKAEIIKPIYSAYAKITPSGLANIISAAGATWKQLLPHIEVPK